LDLPRPDARRVVAVANLDRRPGGRHGQDLRTDTAHPSEAYLTS